MTNPSGKYADHLCKMRTVSGDPCPSPALKDGDYCHYHKVMGPNPVQLHPESPAFSHVYLPRLESAASIQAAISDVCELMLHRRIEPKEASALFYAMQVASQNLAPLNGAPNADAANSASAPLPPGTIQASAEPQRRRPGRPRKAAPQLVKAHG